jgi:predicted phosphate transport protein (TIGR00153 family)
LKIDSLIRWFLPREERFHDLFATATDNLAQTARLFAEIAHSRSLEERRVKSVELHGLEHKGDQITRQIFEALNSTFLTPLDREDIHSIASDLDDILDYLDGVAEHLILFELADSPEALRQFADILVAMTEELARITGWMWDLGNAEKLSSGMVRISEFENQGDALHRTVIADLFRSDSRGPIEILKWKEVYQGLEDACDECKDFTHTIGNILTKNA